MSPTRISVSSSVSWTAEADASAYLLLRAAHAQDQTVVEEELVVEGAQIEDGPPALGGSRPFRFHATAGAVRLHYRALVDVDSASRTAVADGKRLPDGHQLPFDLVPWTLPSRYAQADLLAGTANAELGLGPRERALLLAAVAWVRTRIAYIPGASDSFTAADETLLVRKGVCRDMAHLSTALLRALAVPTRVVSCYAPLLDPPDFHALVEAHDGDAWRLMDATGLAPVETLVRIATGRDAAEIAWATGSGALRLDDVRVAAEILN